MNNRKEELKTLVPDWCQGLSVRSLNCLLQEYGQDIFHRKFKQRLYNDLLGSPRKHIANLGPISRGEIVRRLESEIKKEKEMSFNDSFEFRDFRIIGDASEQYKPLSAICQFAYKDFLISVSTAGINKGGCQIPVCVFHGKTTDNVAKDGFDTVQEAIDWINEQT